jgi:hypothetical protein
MINIQGIFEGLIQFFTSAPSGRRNQFVDVAVSNGIDTAANINLWLDHFLQIGDEMGMFASADFDVMMTKRRDVGLERATNGARAIYDTLVELATFTVEQLQLQITALEAFVTEEETRVVNATFGRVWIEANAPGSAALKADTLRAVDFGLQMMGNAIEGANSAIAQLQERIIRLGGTV